MPEIGTSNAALAEGMSELLEFWQSAGLVLQDLPALSVLGNSTDALSVSAEAIAAPGNGYLFGTDGDELLFTKLTGSMVPNDLISNAMLRNSSALSVIGRSANSTGDPADIVAGANDRLLTRVSNAIAFTQLTAGMFSSTVVPDAALSSNVPLLNAANVFTEDLKIQRATARLWIDATSGPPHLRYQLNGQYEGLVGVESGTGSIITGSAAGDFSVRARTGRFLFSGDDGATVHFKVSPSGLSSSAINGVAFSDFARLSQSSVFTGGVLQISAASPRFTMFESDAAANNGVWDWNANGEALTLRVANDGFNAFGNVMVVERTGTTVDSIALSASLVDLGSLQVGAAGSLPASFSGVTVSSLNATGKLVTDSNGALSSIYTYFDNESLEISAGTTSGHVAGIVLEPQVGTTSAGEGINFFVRSALVARIGTAISSFADDSAAASGGVTVGQLYRTGSALKIRVS